MAGYSRIYCIGHPGGYLGADGLNPIDVMLWVGDSDRQWVEARYFTRNYKPMGNIETMVPDKPLDFMGLLDACLIFCPRLFVECPSMRIVKNKMKDLKRVSFDQGEDVPEEWDSLREEALPIFKKLVENSCIYEAEFKPIKIND